MNKSKRHDFIPSNMAEFYEYSKKFLTYLKSKTTDHKEPEWPEIPYDIVNELSAAFDKFEASYNVTLIPSTDTKGARETVKQDRKELERLMRYITKFYLHRLPATSVDRINLDIPEHDTIRTTIPVPSSTARVRIKLTVAHQLTFVWELEGELSDSRAVQGVRIHYGVVAADPSAQSAKTGKHYYLSAPPTTPDQLKEDVFTRKKELTITLPYEDSGHECWFCPRIENAKGEQGPWGEIFHAVIP